jgi:DNA-binding NtrC family response regulator
MSSKILFLDDRWRQENWKQSFDEWLPESVEAVYEEYGYKAIERLRENSDVKLVFLDMQFENQTEQGELILNKIKEHYPDLKVIILTSLNDSQLALRLVHDEKKAYYFFFKDALDPDQIKKLIENAIETYDLRARAIRKTDLGMIVGESPGLVEVLRLTERASLVDSTVLITGESGTGKELLARSIHLNSRRSQKAFVAINCGAIPEELVESELFGHVKGAFTNAIADRRGRFEMADSGTIFLDEIAEMSVGLQAKLLRVIERGELERVGSEKTLKVDVRLVAATHQDLEASIKLGSFRKDLYYRLNVLSLHVPPLRARRQDIPVLVNHFIERLNNKLGEAKDISEKALHLLEQHNWPGNIRELENALERAVVTSKGDTLDVQDFSFLTSTIGSEDPGGDLINRWVEDVLNGEVGWNDIRREFGAAGDGRKKIVEGIVLALKRAGTSPTGDELAKVLKINRNYVNQIVKNLGLQLRELRT